MNETETLITNWKLTTVQARYIDQQFPTGTGARDALARLVEYFNGEVKPQHSLPPDAWVFSCPVGMVVMRKSATFPGLFVACIHARLDLTARRYMRSIGGGPFQELW